LQAEVIGEQAMLALEQHRAELAIQEAHLQQASKEIQKLETSASLLAEAAKSVTQTNVAQKKVWTQQRALEIFFLCWFLKILFAQARTVGDIAQVKTLNGQVATELAAIEVEMKALRSAIVSH
jgi:GAF domain-containing protein